MNQVLLVSVSFGVSFSGPGRIGCFGQVIFRISSRDVCVAVFGVFGAVDSVFLRVSGINVIDILIHLVANVLELSLPSNRNRHHPGLNFTQPILSK